VEDQIRQQIVEFITSNFLFGDTDKRIDDKESLLENGIIDSTGVLELIAFIEETFGIKVEDEEIVPENLDTILDITFFVKQKLSAAKSAASS
jgi:acyl carrier protein